MPQVRLSPKAVNRVTLSRAVAAAVVGDGEHPATATAKATAGSHGGAIRGRNIRGSLPERFRPDNGSVGPLSGLRSQVKKGRVWGVAGERDLLSGAEVIGQNWMSCGQF